MHEEKDKARDLVANMLQHQMVIADERYSLNKAKQCAIIAVDEILSELKTIDFNYDLETSNPRTCLEKTSIPYWEKVKEAIIKL